MQKQAVGQPGELIIKGQVLNLALGRFPFRDVGADAQHGPQHSVLTSNESPTTLHDQGSAILAALSELSYPFPVPQKLDDGVVKGQSIAVEQISCGSTADLLRGPSVKDLRAFVPKQEALLDVQHGDRFLSLV